MYIYFFASVTSLLWKLCMYWLSGNVSSDFEILQFKSSLVLFGLKTIFFINLNSFIISWLNMCHKVSSLFRLIWTHSWRCYLRWNVWKPGVCASSLWSSSHSSFHAPIDVQALIVILRCYPFFFGFFFFFNLAFGIHIWGYDSVVRHDQ